MSLTGCVMTGENNSAEESDESNILRRNEGARNNGDESSSDQVGAWYVEQNDQEEEEISDISEDDTDDIENDVIDEKRNIFREDELARASARLYRRREVLRQIHGSNSIRSSRDPHNDGAYGSEEGRNSPVVELSGGLLAIPCQRRKTAFTLDLIGLLRRHRNNISHMKIKDSFLRRMPMAELLANVLLKCVGKLPLLRTLHVRGHDAFRYLPHDAFRYLPHSLRELYLDDVLFRSQGEVEAFADCLGAYLTTRRENFTAFEIVGYAQVKVDPIFCAVGGDDKGRQGNIGHHLPNLEEFRLRAYEMSLEEDSALVRVLKMPSIKDLSLEGFIQHRHVILMERHLSIHPRIETLRVDVEDFLNDIDPTPEQKQQENQQLFAVMQSLIRLVVANPNMKNVDVGFYNLPRREILRPLVLELVVRVTQNRVGLGRFLGGSSSSPSPFPPSSPPRWSPRECVELLLRLRTLDIGGGHDIPWIELWGEGFVAAAATEALYLSIRAMPDLLCPPVFDESALTAASDRG